MKHLYTLLAFLFICLNVAAANRTAKATLWIDTLNGVDNYYLQRNDRSNVNIFNGLNLVKFDAKTDNPLTLGISGDGISPRIYINGNLVNFDDATRGKFTLNLKDGDIVRAYLHSDPEHHFAIFNVDEHLIDGLTITRDLVQQLDFVETALELTGTHYDITIDSDRFPNVQFKVYDATLVVGEIEILGQAEGEDVEGGEGNIDGDDETDPDGGVVLHPDANGIFQVDITKHTLIVIKDLNAGNITSIHSAESPDTIYNLQGIPMSNPDTLPAGIYITRGKKILKR